MTIKQKISQFTELTFKKIFFVDAIHTCSTALLIFIFQTSYRTERRIGHDLVSYVLPAFAMENNLGSPYNDYYINRPPGAFVFIQLWAKVFGYKLQSWVILESILLFFISLLLYSVFSFLIPKFASVISAFLALFILLFSGTLSMFLPLEIIGVFIVLLATRTLIFDSSSLQRKVVFFALLIFAASVREQYSIVFVLMYLSVVISKAREQKPIRTTQACLLGVLLTGSILCLHFLMHSNFASFVSVFKDEFNSEKHPFSNYFGWIFDAISFHSVTSFSSLVFEPQNHLYIICIAFFCLLFSICVFLKNSPLNSRMFAPFIVGMTGLSLISSVSWQSSGFRFSSHYAISSLIGIFLCTVSLISFLIRFVRLKFDLQKKWAHIPLVLLLVLAPSSETIDLFRITLNKTSAFAPTTQFSRFTSDQPSLNELKAAEIIRGSSKDFQCSISVYGWGSGSFYLFSKSKPCTKYFLPNLVSSERMAIDYKSELEQNPPRVINYGCLDYLSCSDLDISEFETIVFPYSKVIADCYLYIATEQLLPLDANSYHLFVSRYDKKSDQSDCIKAVTRVSK